MTWAPTQNRRQANATGLGAAWAAFAVGVLYAAISVYWGAGGTWLLDTVGSSLAKPGHNASALVVLAVWLAVALKVIAAVLPLLAVGAYTSVSARWPRPIRLLTWIEAAILIIYGLVLTTVGLLVQAGVIGTSANADHRALEWHAYLWDPWFLVWGLLVAAALLRSR
ncbi:MAG TPA: DUF3995 domain-containing protein [Trebonia sp.]|jgi:hypothetical protein|nr:DUF3995 domain-containing protein [Trebonia sp.]